MSGIFKRGQENRRTGRFSGDDLLRNFRNLYSRPAESDQFAAGGPGPYGLVGQEARLPLRHRSGQGDPGPDLVSAGTSFAGDFLVGVRSEPRLVSPKDVIEKLLIELDVDLAVLGFARPMG